MTLYAAICFLCKKPMIWFSGNYTQICDECGIQNHISDTIIAKTSGTQADEMNSLKDHSLMSNDCIKFSSYKKDVDIESDSQEIPKEPNKLADRFNKGKLRWHNVPLWMFEDIIKVGQFGENKYSAFNFLKGFKITELQNSLMRHLAAFDNPFVSDTDLESKESHLAHAAWNIIVMLYVMKYKPEMDDRWKPNENT